MLNNLDEYKVYVCKDGRTRAYNYETKEIVSYPKLLMENILGRKLKPNEDVHHKDGNPLNNNPWNLAVVDHAEHEKEHAKAKGYNVKEKKENNFEHKGRNRKYSNKEMVCPECGKSFIWTAYQQNRCKRDSQDLIYCCLACYHHSMRKLVASEEEIVTTLKRNKGNFEKTAKGFNISSNALRKRLRKAGLSTHSEDYK